MTSEIGGFRIGSIFSNSRVMIQLLWRYGFTLGFMPNRSRSVLLVDTARCNAMGLVFPLVSYTNKNCEFFFHHTLTGGRGGSRFIMERKTHKPGSIPSRVRTDVFAVKERDPGPLDDGDTVTFCVEERVRTGFQPGP